MADDARIGFEDKHEDDVDHQHQDDLVGTVLWEVQANAQFRKKDMAQKDRSQYNDYIYRQYNPPRNVAYFGYSHHIIAAIQRREAVVKFFHSLLFFHTIWMQRYIYLNYVVNFFLDVSQRQEKSRIIND